MTDKEWKSRIKKCLTYLEKYQSELGICEAEYNRRFGVWPDENDDDLWIDLTTQGNGNGIPIIDTVVDSLIN